jgi:hypothetical protein
MFLFIQIPKEYVQYTELLVEKEYEPDETSVVVKLVEHGIMQMLSAISANALGRENMDPLLDFLENTDSVRFAIPDDLIGHTKIEPLTKLLDISENLLLRLLFFTGLYTEGYYFLRHDVPEYDSDFNYQFIVDHMPHDPEFESMDKVPEDVLGIIDDEKLTVHRIH